MSLNLPRRLNKRQIEVILLGENKKIRKETNNPPTNLTNVTNVSMPEPNNFRNILIELLEQVRALRGEVTDLKGEVTNLKDEVMGLRCEVTGLRGEVKDFKQSNSCTIAKLTQEVVSVKFENRKLYTDPLIFVELPDMQKLPLNAINDLIAFKEEVQQSTSTLVQFKQLISKTGGDGPAQFIRTAIRKVFTDELSSLYSWKGTSTKPSAEKCYLVQLIKNICHIKYHCTEKDLNSVLQKHFVHAKDRLQKRKRVE